MDVVHSSTQAAVPAAHGPDGGLCAPPLPVVYLARHTEGGSALSLLTLVGGLDRRRYEPRVLFHAIRDRALVADFEALGIPVMGLAPPWSTGRPRLPSLQLSARLGPRGWRGTLRSVWRLMRVVAHVIRRDLRWQPALARELLRHRPGLVHCNSGLRAHRLDLLLCMALRLPVICHVRNFEPLTGVERLAARAVWRFIYISNAVAADLERQGIPAQKGMVVPNALLEGDLAAAGAVPRTALGLTAEHLVVANVGRLVRWKGQDVFLRALAEAAPGLPHLRALIVGGPDADASSRTFAAELRQQAQSLGLGDRVVFTGHRRDAQRLMAAADVVVHSAVTPEPFGRVIIEALAAGRPVIATAAGGVLDILEHEVTGLLVPPGDAPALARAIERLARDPGLRERLGTAGRRHVIAAFNRPQHVDRVTALYAQCLQHGAQPGRATGGG
jgi:glycosyltransferase involved in cell wall biosynthesis